MLSCDCREGGQCNQMRTVNCSQISAKEGWVVSHQEAICSQNGSPLLSKVENSAAGEGTAQQELSTG